MDFKPSTWAQPAQDIAAEYNTWEKAETELPAVQTKREALSESLVRRGLLDPETGATLDNTKQGKILMDNARGFSRIGKLNYERTFGHA